MCEALRKGIVALAMSAQPGEHADLTRAHSGVVGRALDTALSESRAEPAPIRKEPFHQLRIGSGANHMVRNIYWCMGKTMHGVGVADVADHSGHLRASQSACPLPKDVTHSGCNQMVYAHNNLDRARGRSLKQWAI